MGISASAVIVEVPPEGISTGRMVWGPAGESWLGWGSTRLTACGTASERLAAWDALISAARSQRTADERELHAQRGAS